MQMYHMQIHAVQKLLRSLQGEVAVLAERIPWQASPMQCPWMCTHTSHGTCNAQPTHSPQWVLTDNITVMQICNMLWGLAALGQLTAADLRRATDHLVALGVGEAINFKELRQLLQVRSGCRAPRLFTVVANAQAIITRNLWPCMFSV